MQGEEESDSLELKAWRSLRDTYKVVYAKVNSDLRRYGLTPPQYSVLRAIGQSQIGSLAMNEIGKDLIVTYANITQIVDNLEKGHYLKRVRETEDRRIVRVRLTQKGRSLWKKISAIHRKQIAELMRGLPAEELKNLIADTSKIRNRILENQEDDRPLGKQKSRTLQELAIPQYVIRQ
ncbi:MAG: MarR family transcriptional regulator [archaeon]|nr:MarR family transcriptional regulator [archaeon]